MVNVIPIWAIEVAIAAIIVICGEVGYRIGARAKTALHENPFGVLQAAIFGLVALLLAFSFSLGIARYDARRIAIVREAGSMRVVMRRSELLDSKAAALMHGYLNEYVNARIAFAAAGDFGPDRSSALQQSEALQDRMWSVALAEARNNQRPEILRLFIEALDNMFVQDDDVEAILTAHIPDAVLGVLTIVIVFASTLLGVGFGRTGRRGTIAIVFFAIIMAVVVGVNIDLDRSQRGFIRVSLQPLEAVSQLLSQSPTQNKSMH